MCLAIISVVNDMNVRVARDRLHVLVVDRIDCRRVLRSRVAIPLAAVVALLVLRTARFGLIDQAFDRRPPNFLRGRKGIMAVPLRIERAIPLRLSEMFGDSAFPRNHGIDLTDCSVLSTATRFCRAYRSLCQVGR
jgi:hypothetical protein